MVITTPHPSLRPVGSLVHALHAIRLLVLALLVGLALGAVLLSHAVPGTLTAALGVVVVAYVALSAVPLWLVMGRLIRSAAEASREAEPAAPLAPVIPLHAWRTQAS